MFTLNSNVYLFAACMGCVALGACTTSSHKHGQTSPVRKVDFRAAPDFEHYAGHVRQLGNSKYPQVCALLADGDVRFPKRFDVFLKPRLPSGNPGETRIAGIYVDTSYLEAGDEDIAYFDTF